MKNKLQILKRVKNEFEGLHDFLCCAAARCDGYNGVICTDLIHTLLERDYPGFEWANPFKTRTVETAHAMQKLGMNPKDYDYYTGSGEFKPVDKHEITAVRYALLDKWIKEAETEENNFIYATNAQ